jgi:CheY-like chemotaxis protein
VVDDEPLLCLSIQRMLAPRHDVVACSDPREALRRVEAGEPFDLVILDLAMPQMNGMALYARLREVAPRLAGHVVVVHGGTLDDETQALLEARSVPRVAKPFDMGRLSALVDAMVGPGDDELRGS